MTEAHTITVVQTEPVPNPFGWHLPLTDSMLTDESPYAPLEEPAQNIAERLVMLTHLGFDRSVWGMHTGRGMRYWEALGERVEGSTNTPDVATFWCTLAQSMPCVPLRSPMILHEKNLLCRPTSLPTTPVEDMEVLDVLRTYTLDLRDRARLWATTRREIRSRAQAVLAAAETEEPTA